MEKIKVIICEPNKKAKIELIDNTLEAKQKIVEGLIEPLYLDDNTVIICNEEGKVNNLEMNRPIREDGYHILDIIFGTFIICGVDEEGFCSLTDAQIEKYLKEYKNPYRFITEDSCILCEEIFD